MPALPCAPRLQVAVPLCTLYVSRHFCEAEDHKDSTFPSYVIPVSTTVLLMHHKASQWEFEQERTTAFIAHVQRGGESISPIGYL